MNADYNTIHSIRSKENYLLYHYPSYNLIWVNKTVYMVLSSIKSGFSLQEISSKYNIKIEQLKVLSSKLESICCNNLPSTTKTEEASKEKELNRITLHISNDCNLRCKYCYANGGNYHQKRSLMNIETADAFIEFCTKNFISIKQIVFFGGEPLLNINCMKYICNKFESLYKEKAITFIPQFSIITNGTIISEEIISFIKQYIHSISVSIDGPKFLNDANRIYKDGKGSYNNISQFIHTLQNRTNVDIRYESTYTKDHLKAQYTYEDIRQFLKNEFGLSGSIVNEQNFKDIIDKEIDDVLNLDLNEKALSEDNFKNLPHGFWNILSALIYKEPVQVCPIAKKTLAINVNGDIYPCHILNGTQTVCLGNIKRDNIFNTSETDKIITEKFKLKQNIECQNCWAQKLCGGCALKKYYNTEKGIFTEPNTEYCQKYLLYIEKILSIIAIIRKNPLLWSSLLAKGKGINNFQTQTNIKR